MSLRGQLLVARPELIDPNFARSVVSILAHDDDGAMGVVLNRVADAVIGAESPVDGDLDPLVLEDRLYIGGPVEPEALIVVGENPDGSAAVWSGDPGPDPAVPTRGRAYLGYAGWGPGQLEVEVAEGSWVVCRPTSGDHLMEQPEGLWRQVLARQPVPTRILAWYPEDLSLN